MARGRPVRIDGKVRTIPAASVPRFEAIEAQLAELYPGDEHVHERGAALRAAARHLIGDIDPGVAGDELDEARTEHEAAAAAARMVVMLTNEDRGPGHESALSREVGVDRLTIRKWLGKQDRR